MKALVVYESMYGNTHQVAEAIADGIRLDAEVEVVPVRKADAALLGNVDLLVVGGPTHVHGMSRPSTRKGAIEAAAKPDADVDLDPDAAGPGLRDWFDGVARMPDRAAAFDTRRSGPAVITGRASKGIARHLRHEGARLVTEPESFLVTKDDEPVDGELDRARHWGARLTAAWEVSDVPR